MKLDEADEELGFGSVEGCQEKVGILCCDCRYRDACLDELTEEEAEYAWLEGLTQ